MEKEKEIKDLKESEGIFDEEEMKERLMDIRIRIINVLKKFCDLREDFYNIIALWIMGTWIHKSFNSYPYLFFNATKGSGKSRLLSLISQLCWQGIVTVSMSEAVLFRTAEMRTLLIDEFESVGDRHKQALRELLNAAYKKGGHVERIKKVKTLGEDKMVVERFNVYCPVAMANIWGMDSVLSDRCISLILDKSDKKQVTLLIENFETDPEIQELKRFVQSSFSVGSACQLHQNTYTSVPERWNSYVLVHTLHTLHTLPPQPTLPTLTITEIDFFDKIRETKIEGRNLELFFPLFILANLSGALDETIQTAKKMVQDKKKDSLAEDRYMELLSYLNKLPQIDEWLSISQIYADLKENEKDWISPEWISRALKTNNLIIERRRVAAGRQVRIDWNKLKEKIRVHFPQEEVKEEKIEDE